MLKPMCHVRASVFEAYGLCVEIKLGHTDRQAGSPTGTTDLPRSLTHGPLGTRVIG